MERFGDRFLTRLFTSTEQKVSERRKNRVESYAKRFAAKEAFVKALGTGIRNGINFKDISLIKTDVDGFDYDVIRSANEAILNNPFLFLENLGVHHYK